MAKIRNIFKKLRGSNQGTAAIEVAICMPIVLALMFAAAQYGIFFYHSSSAHRSVDNAVREVTLLNSPTQSEIETRIASSIPSNLTSSVQYTVNLQKTDGLDFALITMSYTRRLDMPFVNKFDMTSRYKNYTMLSSE